MEAVREQEREGEVRVVWIGVGGWVRPGTPTGVGEAVAGTALRSEPMDEVLLVAGIGLLEGLFELLGGATVLICLGRFLVRPLRAPLEDPLSGPADALGGSVVGALRAPVLPLSARMALYMSRMGRNHMYEYEFRATWKGRREEGSVAKKEPPRGLRPEN